MERHELVDINGKNTGKVLTTVEAKDMSNIPDGYYMPVVGIVILNSNNQVLMQKRSRFKKSNPGKWGVCGGKIDFGETPDVAGVRETTEEIGVDLKREELKLLATDANGKYHYTVYYVKKDINPSECKIQEEELEEVKFFGIDEIENLDTEGTEWLDNLKKIVK